jgi:hypothetical protein
VQQSWHWDWNNVYLKKSSRNVDLKRIFGGSKTERTINNLVNQRRNNSQKLEITLLREVLYWTQWKKEKQILKLNCLK